eukprot:TRINITY_DN17829_c0_g1_i1.p1 TRINITY_DN17829_c0_g1~~TRINITY_DN17829_c0_g1_i1.p1  ORF type:complete len:218 (-),score=51.14 TRINITY_DN17829_c0_g1_i1:128-781(-)
MAALERRTARPDDKRAGCRISPACVRRGCIGYLLAAGACVSLCRWLGDGFVPGQSAMARQQLARTILAATAEDTRTAVDDDQELDAWAVMSLAPQSTKEDIRARYRELAQTEHPDVNPGDEKAAERFAVITQAYNELLEFDEMDAAEKRQITKSKKKKKKALTPYKRRMQQQAEATKELGQTFAVPLTIITLGLGALAYDFFTTEPPPADFEPGARI